ncbi:MAG: hypothetical protein ACHP93_00815 [Solirubrobacterales bacterium]
MIEIRSYRRVFDLERRIYRVDRLRLNPGGIPVRGLVYFLAIAATTAILSRLPLVAVLANALPWYLRDLALPGASAALLTVIRVEGRPFHLAAHALARYRSGPRHLTGARLRCASACVRPGGRWRPEEILILPDGSDCRMRRVRYTGPGAVLVGVAHERIPSRFRVLGIIGRRADLTVRQLPGVRAPARGQVIVLERAARLEVR